MTDSSQVKARKELSYELIDSFGYQYRDRKAEHDNFTIERVSEIIFTISVAFVYEVFTVHSEEHIH